MAQNAYDAIVLGLGAMGSAAMYRLAELGARVCGVERYGIAHDRGSSHGMARMFRKAYFEHPDYLPLLERAHSQWMNLEEASGKELFVRSGLILSGVPESPLIRGLDACYKAHDLPHRKLDVSEARAEFSQFTLPPDHVVYHDPDAGYLLPEACIEQHIALAQQQGAELLIHEEALTWRSDDNSVTVTTNQREITATTLVLTAGPWAAATLGELGVSFQVLRKVQLWYTGNDMTRYRTGAMPCFYIDTDYGGFYGFPAFTELGIKVAEHTGGDPVDDPDRLNRGLEINDETKVHRMLKDTFPETELRRTHFSVCMYSMTADHHFIVDRHPRHENVIIAAGFSGHGFKFSPVIGEILADLVVDGTTMHPMHLFKLDRFAHTF
jgi:sarcosine oxidase